MPSTPRSTTRTQFSRQKAQRWFDAGWGAAATADILTHPGSDTAKVRGALRTLTDQEITDTTARRSYANGVRAQLTDDRANGLL